MNREIKFRAWDNELKIFRQSFYIDQLGLMYFNNGGMVGTLETSNYVLQQFTGLKDENEKDIYEGDILKISWSEWNMGGYLQSDDMTNEHEKIVTVKYKAPSFCFFSKNEIQTSIRKNAKIEVIGNIYENPELLEEQK